MLSDKMQEAFNDQINAETYSAYLYWSMAAWFESQNLAGMATWMKVQAQEEMTHAQKFYDFIHERGGTVKLKAIDGPDTEWKSPLAVFESACAHEQKVTALINGLVETAEAESDHASKIFLNWFVTEQVEEEAHADEIVQKLKMIGEMPGGVYMMDKELGQRSPGGEEEGE